MLNNLKAGGWEDVVGNAFDIVADKIGLKVKEKLIALYPDNWEHIYEGADTSAIGIINHDDFQEYLDEVVAHFIDVPLLT